MRWLPPKSSSGFDKKKREEKLSSSWRKWNKVVHGRHKPARRCSWWEALRALEVAKWQRKYRVDWDAIDGRNGGGSGSGPGEGL